MGYFSAENIKKLRKGYAEVSPKHAQLLNGFVWRNYKDERAKEFARHGFARRVKTTARCIQNIFRILPPEGDDLPSAEEVTDATVNLQAFVFNVYGATDNLAWIWVREKGVKESDGSPLRDLWVGLREKNKLVRESFSPEFQAYLKSMAALVPQKSELATPPGQRGCCFLALRL